MKVLRGIAVAVVAYLAVQFAWELLIELNLRLFPSIPWFLLPAAFVILLLSRLLADRFISISIFAKPTLDRRQIALLGSGTLGCMCLSMWLASIFPYWMVAAHRSDLNGTGLVATFAVAAPVFAAVIEEIIFRGVLQTAFLRVTKPLVAVGLAAMLCTLAHTTNPEFASQWLFYVVFSAFMGFVAFTSGSLLPSMVLHGSMNFFGNLIFHFIGPWNSSTLPTLWQGVLLAGTLVFFATVFILGRSQGSRY